MIANFERNGGRCLDILGFDINLYKSVLEIYLSSDVRDLEARRTWMSRCKPRALHGGRSMICVIVPQKVVARSPGSFFSIANMETRILIGNVGSALVASEM